MTCQAGFDLLLELEVATRARPGDPSLAPKAFAAPRTLRRSGPLGSPIQARVLLTDHRAIAQAIAQV